MTDRVDPSGYSLNPPGPLPLIDHLTREAGSYMIEFVPSDEISEEEKCFLRIECESLNGERITQSLGIIEKLSAFDRISQIVHGGGENYRFSGLGFARTLNNLDKKAADEAISQLRRIARIAQEAYAGANLTHTDRSDLLPKA